MGETLVHGYDVTGKNNVAIVQMDWDMFVKFWPQISDELDKIPHVWRNWTKEFIFTSMEQRTLTCWSCGSPPYAEFVFFMQVNVYPRTRILNMPLAFGKFRKNMIPLLDATVENYARSQDCDEIEIYGRLGWRPHLEEIGFKEEARVWSRPVTVRRTN